MATAVTDSISISDRMSSISSLFVPSPIKTTTISTIAVQCCESRMVIALLQSKDTLNLRVLEMTPSLTSLGSNVEESEGLLREHKNVLEKLGNNQTPVEEFFRKTSNLPSDSNPELYSAMGDSLGQAWRDLIANLELRKEILNLGIYFHRCRVECLDDFKNIGVFSKTGKDTLRKYSSAIEAGKKLIEKLEIVEDSWESATRVNGWLEDLAKKLQEYKNIEKKYEEDKKLNEIYDELKAELDDIIASQDFESKAQRLVGLLSKVNSASNLPQTKKSWLESTIYSLMEEYSIRAQTLSNVIDFLNEMRQIDMPNFKEKYYEKLKMVRNLTAELTVIIERRLGIREDYEEILQNVLGYSEDEVYDKLSQDKDLEINRGLENIRFERHKQEIELFELFDREIQKLEAAGSENLERILSAVINLIVQLENAPNFQKKAELIEKCAKLREEILLKIQALENISNFLNNYRDLSEKQFMTEHNTILEDLEKIDAQESSLGKVIKNRISVRRSYEDILKNPTQFEEDEIIELLTREDSLDITSAFKNIKDEKKLQEMLQTLDFPLPENLETARNDLEDFKSFEEIIQSLPNSTEELIEKTIIKKTKILKCIEFYELIESIDRVQHIKNISRLEIELFGTTHISESIYEEKINKINQLRQIEHAETEKVEKPKVSNTEVQTEGELLKFIQQLPHTPPPLLIEIDTQTNDAEPLQFRNSETQTAKIRSSFSATQTQNIEQRRPIAVETQTVEIEPQIVYLIPQTAPVKLRNSQTQTQIDELEEFMTKEVIQKRSQMFIEETFEEFESKKEKNNVDKLSTSSIFTQTDNIFKKFTDEIQDDDTLLVKTSDVESIAKFFLNTECQTERDTKIEENNLNIIIPPEISLSQIQGPIYSKLVLPAETVNREKFNKFPIQYQYEICQNDESIQQKNSTTIERLYNQEGTKTELLVPQMSVRDRVKAWQITTPNENINSIEKNIHKRTNFSPHTQISRDMSVSEEKNHYYEPHLNEQSLSNYRLLFQSPLEDCKPESMEENQLLQKKFQAGEYEQKRSVAEYRKMFQSFEESLQNQNKEICDNPRTIPKHKIDYRKLETTDKNPKSVLEQKEDNKDKFDVTESARERAMAMYRKLLQYNNEGKEDVHNLKQNNFKIRKAFVPEILQPTFARMDYKNQGIGKSEESIDGVYCSSSSERSQATGYVYSAVNKFNTLPIRPSKFVPKEIQESDYESDYDCKIPSMWVPPGGKLPYTRKSFYFKPIPSDLRSKSVPPAEPVNRNEKYSKSVDVTSRSYQMNAISTPIPTEPDQQFYPKLNQQVQNKPIPPPKPNSKSTSPSLQISEEIVTTTREASLKSETTKREEIKLILAPPKTLQVNNEQLKIDKPTSYYVSITSPPIIVPNEEVIIQRSYESNEERMEERIEKNCTESLHSPLAVSQVFTNTIDMGQFDRKGFPTVTRFFSQKELMHPILYELEDKDKKSKKLTREVEEFDKYKDIFESHGQTSDSMNKSMEIMRFTPSKFIPMVTSEEEFSSTEEEFVVKPKWKPLQVLSSSDHKKDKTKFRPVKGPSIQEKSTGTDPGVFYMACDFSCEYGIVKSQK